MNNEKIGNNIKKWRKLKKLTQQELGLLIDKNVKSIQRYETGVNPIPIDVLSNIAKALNIGIDKLIYENGGFSNKIENNKYDTFIELLSSLGYEIEQFPLYIGEDNWEDVLILKKEKKELQLNMEDTNVLFSDIEKYIDFSIHKMENSTEFKDKSIEDKIENSIDKYYTDGFIEKIKEQIGYYGSEYIEPLNTAQRLVWEKWKEENIDKK